MISCTKELRLNCHCGFRLAWDEKNFRRPRASCECGLRYVAKLVEPITGRRCLYVTVVR